MKLLRVFVHAVDSYNSDDSGLPLGVVNQTTEGEYEWESFRSGVQEVGYPTLEEAMDDLIEELIHNGVDFV